MLSALWCLLVKCWGMCWVIKREVLVCLSVCVCAYVYRIRKRARLKSWWLLSQDQQQLSTWLEYECVFACVCMCHPWWKLENKLFYEQHMVTVCMCMPVCVDGYVIKANLSWMFLHSGTECHCECTPMNIICDIANSLEASPVPILSNLMWKPEISSAPTLRTDFTVKYLVSNS